MESFNNKMVLTGTHQANMPVSGLVAILAIVVIGGFSLVIEGGPIALIALGALAIPYLWSIKVRPLTVAITESSGIRFVAMPIGAPKRLDGDWWQKREIHVPIGDTTSLELPIYRRVVAWVPRARFHGFESDSWVLVEGSNYGTSAVLVPPAFTFKAGAIYCYEKLCGIEIDHLTHEHEAHQLQID